jgi:hypothetical protein
MPNKITEDTVLAEILKRPKASEILAKHNIPCLHCPMVAYEMGRLKIGEIARTYGIDIKSLLMDLNKGIKAK